MIIRIDWAQPNSDGYRMYTVYEADNYFVEFMSSTHVNVHISHGREDNNIILSNGDKIYVMNNNGKTIDSVQTQSAITTPITSRPTI